MFGGFKKSRTFATAIERESNKKLNGVTGSSPVRTALLICKTRKGSNS